MTRLTNKSTEELLELILFHMQNMDRRDYWRTIGGFFKGFFTIIPVIIFIVSTWYIYAYRDTILQDLTKRMTEQMGNVFMQQTQNSTILQNIEQYLPKQQQ